MLSRELINCTGRSSSFRCYSLQCFAGLVLFIVGTARCCGQYSDLGSWNILNVKYTHTEKLSFFAEAQLRSLKFYNDFHYHEYKGAVNYEVHSGVLLTLGAGQYDTYRDGGDFVRPKNNSEIRLWPQLMLSRSIGKLKIEQRYRAEFRFTSNGYRNRFRYRLGTSYPFGKSKGGYQPFLLGASSELFFTDREPYFERLRSLVSINYKLSRTVALQTGYLHQFDYRINDETGGDFLMLGLFIELQGKNVEKPLEQIELKNE